MKRVHISKDHLTSIKLEVDIDMKLVNDIWLTLRDSRIHSIRMNFVLPKISLIPLLYI